MKQFCYIHGDCRLHPSKSRESLYWGLNPLCGSGACYCELDFTDFWVINTRLELVTIVETCGNQRTMVTCPNIAHQCSCCPYVAQQLLLKVVRRHAKGVEPDILPWAQNVGLCKGDHFAAFVRHEFRKTTALKDPTNVCHKLDLAKTPYSLFWEISSLPI